VTVESSVERKSSVVRTTARFCCKYLALQMLKAQN